MAGLCEHYAKKNKFEKYKVTGLADSGIENSTALNNRRKHSRFVC